MILVTVGTNEQPFDRLVRAAASVAPTEPLLVQYGSSQVAHGRGTWIDYLAFDELAEHARRARVVVCHAGVGSIMLARRCGHRPIVVPRRRHLGEAVDDHQLMLGRRLDQAGSVRLLEDEEALGRTLRSSTTRIKETPQAASAGGVQRLSAEVRAVLAGLGAAPALSGRRAA
jgi:UDP-N-acetylglucosamine transferase subunit ALG13